ncbi:hypothetical protein [Scytonema sp. NUACC26]|uniref:hypothetical protein n=1 Tax=Scytonema sp. NUACC26 TaxID=3140176 RepID=UPI0038B3B3EB
MNEIQIYLRSSAFVCGSITFLLTLVGLRRSRYPTNSALMLGFVPQTPLHSTGETPALFVAPQPTNIINV